MARRAGLLLVAAAGLLGACDGRDAPDDAVGQAHAPEIARIVPAGEALANANLPTLDPHTLNDAEIRLALGAGPRCAFRYTSTGKPVLAIGEQADGRPLGGVVKLNGHLVPLEAEPAEGGALRLLAGPVRMTLTPQGSPGAARQEAELVLDIGERLHAGYRGYLGCTGETRPAAPAS